MKIKSIISQHRRDFKAEMYCEFCNHETVNNHGYDDRYYHDEVIPDMECPSCGKSTRGEGGKIDHPATKYPEGFQI